jgi:DNA-binding NtrC family response regulator
MAEAVAEPSAAELLAEARERTDRRLGEWAERLQSEVGGPDGEAMLRLGAKYPGLPMIVVTAYPDAPTVPHHGFFSKPFDTRDLLAAVERLHRARAGGEAVR